MESEDQLGAKPPLDPVAYNLERLLTMLHWIEEHQCSYEYARHSRPDEAKREWHNLEDAIQQANYYSDELAELLLTGKSIDRTQRMPIGLEYHAQFRAKRRAQWTWSSAEHPAVWDVIDNPLVEDKWCDRLERAPTDPVVGKVLCVCVALELAREVVFSTPNVDEAAVDAVQLLGSWIDDPTNEYFEQIFALTFKDDAPKLDVHDVVGWAFRTATSSVGNYEAGWALYAACERAQLSGINEERFAELARRAVMRRISRSNTL